MKYVVIALIVIASVSLYMMRAERGKQSDAGLSSAVEGVRAHDDFISDFVTHASPKPLADADINFMVAGEPRRLSDYRGELLLVNFWATWCAPCRREMPLLDALQLRLQTQGVRVIALSLDREGVGGVEKAQEFFDELDIKHLTLAHDGSFKSARAARVGGLPTTLLIGRDGKEIARLTGEADWLAAHIIAHIEGAL